MLFIVCALLFGGLAIREIHGGMRAVEPQPVYAPYLVLVSALALAFAWPPFRDWRFERLLESRALMLTDGKPVSVHCNTLFDTMLDPNVFAAGHADPATGEIVFQKPWCSLLRSYLRKPQDADERELASLNLFTHEAMHVRGELNEVATECQAVQRNHRAARILGVPESVAAESARAYYRGVYASRRDQGSLSRSYYSEECAPGRALDERLPDAVWKP